ncbi:hypothetical protein XENOCAPTIV_018049, partial [Xenoophorus captivus]
AYEKQKQALKSNNQLESKSEERQKSKAVLCPMSGRPIKMNDLIPVHFTPLDPSLDRVALLNRQVSLLSTAHT